MIFKAKARWKTGIRGVVESDPAAKAIEFSAPPEFRGESGVWSPEHFLLAAVGACFVTTFKAIAESSKFEPVSLVVDVEGTVEKGEGGYNFTQVVLNPKLIIDRESDRARSLRLLEKTERSCLISRSLKAVVSMRTRVEVAAGERAA